MPSRIEKASPQDLSAIGELLSALSLPITDIEDPDIQFFLIREGELLCACIGLQIFGEHALLRSLAVHPEYRSQKLGYQLVHHLLEHSRALEVRHMYLLTTTADSYFVRLNFSAVSRTEVPASIRASKEFSTLCPSSAIVMHYILN